MSINVTLYDTATLLGVYRFFIDSKTYWLDNFYLAEIHSEDEFIDFAKISAVRRIAPFVAPMAQGKAIFTEAGTVTRLKPSYSKMKDPIGPQRVIKRRPGDLALPSVGQGNAPPIMSRWNSLVADIAREHKAALYRLWEWMAARATIDAQVTIFGESMPERTVIFGRDAGQTVVLTGGARWGQTGVSIIDNVESWQQTMRSAQFGGAPTRLTMGSNVWGVMKHDTEIKELLRTYRVLQNVPDIIQGMRETPPGLEYVGKLSPTIDLFVYNDFYHAPDGTVTPYMSANDVVLTSPNINGYRCFGAILDPHANFQPLSIYPRMFTEDDPAVTQVMTQSAPLMLPVNPNCTFKATVV